MRPSLETGMPPVAVKSSFPCWAVVSLITPVAANLPPDIHPLLTMDILHLGYLCAPGSILAVSVVSNPVSETIAVGSDIFAVAYLVTIVKSAVVIMAKVVTVSPGSV